MGGTLVVAGAPDGAGRWWKIGIYSGLKYLLVVWDIGILVKCK